MTTLEGYCFDGQTPAAQAAGLDFYGTEARLTAGEFAGTYRTEELLVSPQSGQADRFIYLPDGRQFQCANADFLETLPAESRSEGFVAWLEDSSEAVAVAIFVIIFALIAGYYAGLPAAAEWAAKRMPIATEQTLGRHILALIDSQEWVRPTRLDAKTQENIRQGFALLCSNLPEQNVPHLEFRDARRFGPNAFALPGGTIVLTDDMVQFAKTPEEVMAVLAHEIGHVQLRHTLRSLIQNSAITLIVAAVTADAASLSVAVASLPVAVAETKYSRRFEADADTYAFALLRHSGYSPEAFASIMERMMAATRQKDRALGFLSTHPDTAERIMRARSAAGK